MKTYRPNTKAAHQAVTVTTAAKTLAQLSVTLDSATEGIVIQAENGDARFTVNGTTPTTSLGFLCREYDQPLPLTRAEAENLRLISASASASMTLQIAQYTEMP